MVHVNALKRNNWYGTIKCYHYIKAFSEQRGIAIVYAYAQMEHINSEKERSGGVYLKALKIHREPTKPL